MTRAWVRVCLTGWALVGSAGCGGGAAIDSSHRPVADPGVAQSKASSDEAPVEPVFTFNRGAYSAELPETFASSAPGLEMLSWVVHDSGGRIELAMQDHTRLPVADSQTLARWSRSGFRVRLIDLESLPELLNQLPPAQSLHHRAWGSILQWQPAFSPMQSSMRMRIHDGLIDLSEGMSPRLLVRGWVEPTIESRGLGDAGGRAGGADRAGGGVIGARVRAELVPQWYEPRRPAFEPIARLTRASEQGAVLHELVLSMALEEGTALVITAEGAQSAPRTGSGPSAPGAVSLGEVMFRSKPVSASGREPGSALPTTRVGVLVLVPVVHAAGQDGG